MHLLKVFFFRTHTKWNHIPLSIREIDSLMEFKSKLSKHIWENIMSEIPTDELDEMDENPLSEISTDELDENFRGL